MFRRLLKPEFKPSDLKKPTVIILILSNLLPIYGVLFLGWEVFPLLLLFWTENIIIGVFNILKIAICSPASRLKWIAKLFVIPFFSFHYAIFMLVHGIFLYTLFGGLIIEETEVLEINPTIIQQMIDNYNVTLGFVSLFISHSISFAINYIHKGEYKEASLYDLSWQPYKRVLVLHLTIVFGGFILISIGSPKAALILLIVLKIAIDALAHLKQHAGKGTDVVTKPPKY